ncbi:MAG TPA: DegV family protein, partial [Thermomicrobiaceae bacterium]|nr:DegV family protein [Thermomicrobiaceae bacterium]
MTSSNARPVTVVTDSTADIPASLLSTRTIEIVPLTVRLGEAEYVDGVELGSLDLLAAMRDGILPKTSQPSIGAFSAIYASLLERNV